MLESSWLFFCLQSSSYIIYVCNVQHWSYRRIQSKGYSKTSHQPKTSIKKSYRIFKPMSLALVVSLWHLSERIFPTTGAPQYCALDSQRCGHIRDILKNLRIHRPSSPLYRHQEDLQNGSRGSRRNLVVQSDSFASSQSKPNTVPLEYDIHPEDT